MEKFNVQPEQEPKVPVTEKIKSVAKKLKMFGIAGIFAGAGSVAQVQPLVSESGSLNPTDSKEIPHMRPVSDEEKMAALAHFEAEHDWLIKIMKSPSYKERLDKEGLTEAMLEKRLYNIMTTPIVMKNTLRPYVDGDAEKPVIAEYVGTGRQKEIQFSPVGYNAKDNFGTGVHESDHASTDGDELMSDYAKNLYGEAYVNANEEAQLRDSLLKMPGIVIDEKNRTFVPGPDASEETNELYNRYTYLEYYGDPTELDARKKAMEYEMEVLGIKKYGERFSQRHLEELREKFKDLSHNSREFLELINPKYFIRIMNTIADVHTDTAHWDDFA